MTDLVERLRENARLLAARPGFPTVSAECNEAAKYIEDLERYSSDVGTLFHNAMECIGDLEQRLAIMTSSRDGYAKQARARQDVARREALEEAAELAANYLAMGWRGFELVDAIRALSDSVPTDSGNKS
jgi:hypothetical protein